MRILNRNDKLQVGVIRAECALASTSTATTLRASDDVSRRRRRRLRNVRRSPFFYDFAVDPYVSCAGFSKSWTVLFHTKMFSFMLQNGLSYRCKQFIMMLNQVGRKGRKKPALNIYARLSFRQNAVFQKLFLAFSLIPLGSLAKKRKG